MDQDTKGLGRLTLAWIWLRGAVERLRRTTLWLPPPPAHDRVVPVRASRRRRSGLVGAARDASAVRIRSFVVRRTTFRG